MDNLIDEYWKVYGHYIDKENIAKHDEYLNEVLKSLGSERAGKVSAKLYIPFRLSKNMPDLSNDKYAIRLFRKGNSYIINVHGASNGKVGLNGKLYTAVELAELLQQKGVIDSNAEHIFTASCYGGLQESGVTTYNAKVSSIHTSTESIISTHHGNARAPRMATPNSKNNLKPTYPVPDPDLNFGELYNKHLDDPLFGLDVISLSNGNIAKDFAEHEIQHQEPWILEMANEEIVRRIDPEAIKQTENAAKKTEETVENAAKKTEETVENAAKKTEETVENGLKKTKLSGKGAAALIIAGSIIVGKTLKDSSSKRKAKKAEKEAQQSPMRNQYSYNGTNMQYNGMEAQIAADISSYRYGKHMTGFVNS